MDSPNLPHVDFSRVLCQAPISELWDYELLTTDSCLDIAQAAFEALQVPLDFPALHLAVVPGDRVALAVDANVPSVQQVVAGVMRAVERCGASEIDIVLSDEATDETFESIAAIVGSQVHLTRHHSSQRECLRYVAADEQADPVYMNRWLVDADFVLPVVASRGDPVLGSDQASSIYPSFADSATRRRELARGSKSKSGRGPAGRSLSPGLYDDPAWWLGVQLIVRVAADQSGHAASVVSGTSHGFRSLQASLPRQSTDGVDDTTRPASALVIAAIDGNSQQQNWVNAARAAVAASRFVLPGGTIVVWSEIDQLPRRFAVDPSDDESAELDLATEATQQSGSDTGESNDEFPMWHPDKAAMESLDKVAEEFRVMLHSRLDAEAIESLGFGSVATAEQLQNLRRSFASCGLLRAAQFTPLDILTSREGVLRSAHESTE